MGGVPSLRTRFAGSGLMHSNLAESRFPGKGRMCGFPAFAGSEFDMCITCKHVIHMSKMIQIRNVPDAVHRQIKARAASEGLSLSEYLLREITRVAEAPSDDELWTRLRSRRAVEPTTPISRMVRETRDER